MFYDVCILDANMRIKKVIKGHDLTRKFWRQFYAAEKGDHFTSTERIRLPKEIRKRLDALAAI